MKYFRIIPCVLLSGAISLGAQQASRSNTVESLRLELEQMRESFERVQREQQQKIDALTLKLEALTENTSQLSTNTIRSQSGGEPQTKSSEQQSLEQQLNLELARETNLPSGATGSATASEWSPSQPLPVLRAGPAYLNISFDALVNAGWSTESDPGEQLQLGHHDPNTRGFSLRNAEIALDGAVDPYFKGFANIALSLDDGETELELEEAYFLTTALPWNLQVKGGQFYADFGRQNPQHPHQWAFVDRPIILTRAFGPDGLRSVGAQLSWLAPTPFYTEFTLGILDGQGETGFNFRNPGDPDLLGVDRFRGRATTDRDLGDPSDLVYTPRMASSFEVTETQTLLVGASGAFGPNWTGPSSRTEIYGADLFWKWKPVDARAGFPFVSWQTEGLYQRFGAGNDASFGGGLPSENLRDYGFYSQVMWGFRPGWVTGLRGEYASGNQGLFDPEDPFRGERYRLAPVLTWYPSEFSKIRLQYDYDEGEYFSAAHSIWLQIEFLLGAHGAHKF